MKLNIYQRIVLVFGAVAVGIAAFVPVSKKVSPYGLINLLQIKKPLTLAAIIVIVTALIFFALKNIDEE